MHKGAETGEIAGAAGFGYGVHGSKGRVTPLSLLVGAGSAVVGTAGGVYFEYKNQDSIPNDKVWRIPGMPPINETCSEHNDNNRDDPRHDLYNYGLPPEK